MVDRRNWLPFIAGFAFAVSLGALSASMAHAQSRIDTTIQPPPRPQTPPGAPPARPGARQTAPSSETDPEQQDTRTRGTLPTPAGTDAEDGEDDPDIITTTTRLPGQPSTAQRRPPVDGDFADPVTPRSLDGVSATGEPQGPTDGADPVENDQRAPADRQPFEVGQDDFDPLAFALEVQPILDRRPRTLFRFEPFQPKGVKIGKFVALTEIELGGFGSTNLFRGTTRPRSDVAFDVRPSVRVVSNWSRHAAEFRARGNFSSFAEFKTENDRAYTLEARGRLDVSKRTNVEALISRDVSQESRSSIDAVQTRGPRSDVTTDTAAGAVNHRFSKLALQLRGSVVDIKYDNASGVSTISGLTNSSRNVRIAEEAGRLTYAAKPNLAVFFETALNQRDYEAISSSDGIPRNSTGQRYRFGVGFGGTSRKVRGEISLGWGTQRPNDNRLGAVDGFLLDANVGYRFSALTSLLLTARTDVTESTLAGSAGALSRNYGVELRHAFRRNLIGTGTLGLSTLDYQGIRLVERERTAGLGLEYFSTEWLVLFSNWRHVQLISTDVGRNYNADEFRVGLRLRQ